MKEGKKHQIEEAREDPFWRARGGSTERKPFEREVGTEHTQEEPGALDHTQKKRESR